MNERVVLSKGAMSLLAESTGLDTDGIIMILTEVIQLQLQVKQLKEQAMQEEIGGEEFPPGSSPPSYVS